MTFGNGSLRSPVRTFTHHFALGTSSRLTSALDLHAVDHMPEWLRGNGEGKRYKNCTSTEDLHLRGTSQNAFRPFGPRFAAGFYVGILPKVLLITMIENYLWFISRLNPRCSGRWCCDSTHFVTTRKSSESLNIHTGALTFLILGSLVRMECANSLFG